MRFAGALVTAALLLAAPVFSPSSAAEPAAWAPADTIALAGADGGALEPAGLVADAFGNLWVSDAARHRLVRFDAAGARLDETGTLGSENNQFRRPGALARWGASAVVVLDRENRRVVAYDAQGRRSDFVVDLAAAELETQLGRVDGVSLAADRGGQLYVADGDRDRVLVFDFTGSFQRALGGVGSGAGAFQHLAALAAVPRGGLVTVEWLAGGKRKGRGGAPDSVTPPRARVQRLEVGGAPLAQWEFACGARAELSVAVDDEGRVAVGDGARGEVLVFDAAGAPLARIPDCGRVAALAFAPDGALLVAAPGRLLRLAPVVARAQD